MNEELFEHIVTSGACDAYGIRGCKLPWQHPPQRKSGARQWAMTARILCYIHVTSMLHPCYIQVASRLHPGCIHVTSRLHPGYIQATSRFHPGSIRASDISSLDHCSSVNIFSATSSVVPTKTILSEQGLFGCQSSGPRGRCCTKAKATSESP